MVYVYDQNHAPGRAQLLSILEVVLGSFDTVFFVVDALDESEPRHALLDLIRTLVTESRFRNIQLLTTSREYLDIKEVMTEVSIRLPMDHEITKNDIRVYVRSVLNTTREFKRWPVEFRLRVEQKLTDGAKGMFRWAVCQFDILRRLKSRAAIDAALNTLPETLDETYERILSNIEPKDRQILRRALLMLCGRAKYSFDVTLGVCEFLSIVLAAEEDFIKHPDNNLYDIGILQDICGCLMKVAGPLEDDEDPSDDKVYLAHYTVAEFILSSRSASSPIPTVAYFGISSADLDCEYGLLIFQAALAYSKQPVGSRLIHRDFIDEHCTDCLHQFENRELTEWTAREISDLTPLIWDLAGLGSLNGEAWFGNLPEQLARELGDFESSPERYSDVYVFYTLICNDWSTLVELFVEAKSSSIFDLGARRNGIALLNEYWLFDVGSHRLLGAERHTSDICQTIGPTRSLLLHLGIHRHDRGGCSGFWSGAECPISAFLKAGADANCTQYDKTPLQLAVERFDNTAVDLFLRNNADPNLVGPDDGAQLCGREFTQERRNWSPLRLCRQAPCVLRSVMSDFGKPPKDLCFGTHSRECESRLPDSRRGIIEQMLLERGARDFVVSPDGVEIGF